MRTSVRSDAGSPSSGVVCRKSPPATTPAHASSSTTLPSIVGAAASGEATIAGAGSRPVGRVRAWRYQRRAGPGQDERRPSDPTILSDPFHLAGTPQSRRHDGTTARRYPGTSAPSHRRTSALQHVGTSAPRTSAPRHLGTSAHLRLESQCVRAPLRLRHVQDRRRAVQLAHAGALARGAGVSRGCRGLARPARSRVDPRGPVRVVGQDRAGHGTDLAVQAGLLGLDPVTCDLSRILHRAHRGDCRARPHRRALARLAAAVSAVDGHRVSRRPRAAVSSQCADVHRRGRSGATLEATWYSIGGGFIVRDGEQPVRRRDRRGCRIRSTPPPTCCDGAIRFGGSVADVVRANERAWRPDAETDAGVDRIWHAMRACLHRGCHTPGELPGGLRVKRRAAALNTTAARRAGGGRRRRRLRPVARRRPCQRARLLVDTRLGELLRAGRQRGERLLRPRGHRAHQRRRGRAFPRCCST